MPETTNEVAEMGTLGHTYFANKSLDRSDLDPDLQRCLWSADTEEEELYRVVEAKEELVGAEFETSRERELWFIDPFGVPLFPGHYDVWRFYPEKSVLIVGDLKLGYIKVTGAESNWQLASYGCMGRTLTGCKTFYGAIIQPRLKMSERLTIGRYSDESLDDAAIEIADIYLDVTTRNHPPTPGEDQCRNCRGKTRCPAYVALVHAAAPMLPTPIERGTAQQIMMGLTAEQFTAVGKSLKFARGIEDDWKDEARRRIEAGTLPDWSLKPGNVMKKVTDPIKAFNLLAEKVPDLTEQQFMSACTLSMDGLRQHVSQCLGISKSKVEAFIIETLEPVIERKPNAPSVVYIGDKEK